MNRLSRVPALWSVGAAVSCDLGLRQLHLGCRQLLAGAAGWGRTRALTSSQGCGELESQGLSLGVEGRADSGGLQALHQLRLGAPGRVILDAVVAAQGHREAVQQKALRGAHKEPAGPHLHVVLLEVLEEEEGGAENICNFNFHAAWDPQPHSLDAGEETWWAASGRSQALFCLWNGENVPRG